MLPSADPVVAAWFQYLETTRNAIGYRYFELEPWAWARLQKTLTVLRRKVYA